MTPATPLLAVAIRTAVPIWTIPSDALSHPTQKATWAITCEYAGGMCDAGRWEARKRTITIRPRHRPHSNYTANQVGAAVLAVLSANPDIWQEAMVWARFRREQAELLGPYSPTKARCPVLDEERYADLERELSTLRRSCELAYSDRAAAHLTMDTRGSRPTEQLSLFDLQGARPG